MIELMYALASVIVIMIAGMVFYRLDQSHPNNPE